MALESITSVRSVSLYFVPRYNNKQQFGVSLYQMPFVISDVKAKRGINRRLDSFLLCSTREVRVSVGSCCYNCFFKKNLSQEWDVSPRLF